jgi:hypothetical protein
MSGRPPEEDDVDRTAGARPGLDGDLDRVIRPAAVLPAHAAREILTWLALQDVTVGGCWSAAVGSIQRYSGPFNGPSGMRGTAVLLGSLHITWDKYQVDDLPRDVTADGAARVIATVDALCDEVLAVAG